ncbi:MAG: molybdopterin molybdotransferase MoeA [Calditrichaeota bacterium]|nr:molybdopterin molybdotransferase MoeA [Calditrichota bacterium]
MITIQEALQIIQKHVPPRRVAEVPLEQAMGRVLAADIHAPEPSPRFTNSAMDGFAVRWVDVQQARPQQPVVLKIVGESQAGFPFAGVVTTGTAVRINTGAVMPVGADTVVPVEDTRVEDEQVWVLSVNKKGQHVRYAGEEFKAGELLLTAGVEITPRHMALLAALGVATVPVYASPEVAILVTGSELVPFQESPAPGQVRESNGLMLRALVSASGGTVVYQAMVPDVLETTQQEIARAAEKADVLIFSGGVSVGPHDHVKEAARAEGFTPIFWRVKQKPGKPLFFAARKETLLFGLPGNPVSAFMGYSYYIHPVLQQMSGREFRWNQRPGRLTSRVANTLDRTIFLRVQLVHTDTGWQVVPLKKQGSHMLTSIAHADGFVVLEPGVTLEAGAEVTVYIFPQ